jgi:3-oxoacyl-[acyl-carrier protein] reductase
MVNAANSPIPIYADLRGKVALVTGGSGSIGGAVCLALARNGAKVVVNGRNNEAIRATVAAIEAEGGEAIGIAADCAVLSELEQLRIQTEAAFGAVDLLVAFAGGGIAKPKPIIEITEQEWRSGIDNNLTATFFTVKTFLPAMLERRSGSIVTMASAGGRVAAGAPAAYGAAKAGIVMFNRHLANEIGGHGIRANCVSPSAILTPRTRRHMSDAQLQAMTSAFPLGRLGTADDVAASTLFLLSDAAAWITGITLDVAGGRIML